MDDVWAKSTERGVDGEPETLVQHTWSVLSRLRDFVLLRPHLPQQLGIPQLWHVLYWAAFLHDFGKAASGFQARLRGGKRWPHRHEVFSLAFLDWIAADLNADECVWIVAAIVSHHQDFSKIEKGYPQLEDDDEDQIAERMSEFDSDVVDKLWLWLSKCSASWIDELGMDALGILPLQIMPHEKAIPFVLNKGAERIYHWLAVYSQFVRQLDLEHDSCQIIGTLALRGYLINADHSASAHAPLLPSIKFQASSVLTSAQIPAESLHCHQEIAWRTEGSALLIAPTGSGKTEAALLWATRQAQKQYGISRLFYTLPYQASMNAMKLRLAHVFGEDKVGLQHGRGLLALYRMLLEREDVPDQAARQARWIQNLAKLNYPPVRVFSPYQMLKGMYRLKGYEALLSDYHNAAFIFDEIHAYEVKRLALILKTIEFLRKNFNAHFFIMSATFPSLIKDKLIEILDNPSQIQAKQRLFQTYQRHQLFLLDGEILSDRGIQRIVDNAMSGQSVLVVCNLVDRARLVFEELKSRLDLIDMEIDLLHSRFNMVDRSRKEALVRDAAGSNSDARQPMVLVATQVVEVSLDIDFDTIYTDPAPLEALVQRFGRVNRGGKRLKFAPVYVYRQPDDGQKIYDPRLIERTLNILGRIDELPIDESQIGDWLDEIYADEISASWQVEFQHTAKEFEASILRPLRAFESKPNLEKLFYQMFDGVEILPESLYSEYEKCKQDDPIQASELLISISWGRYHALRSAGLIYTKGKSEVDIVKAVYDSTTGLSFA